MSKCLSICLCLQVEGNCDRLLDLAELRVALRARVGCVTRHNFEALAVARFQHLYDELVAALGLKQDLLKRVMKTKSKNRD